MEKFPFPAFPRRWLCVFSISRWYIHGWLTRLVKASPMDFLLLTWFVNGECSWIQKSRSQTIVKNCSHTCRSWRFQLTDDFPQWNTINHNSQQLNDDAFKSHHHCFEFSESKPRCISDFKTAYSTTVQKTRSKFSLKQYRGKSLVFQIPIHENHDSHTKIKLIHTKHAIQIFNTKVIRDYN